MGMKIKTSELQDATLDWAVAKCELDDKVSIYFDENGEPLCHDDWPDNQEFKPSINWSQGGPIIEREEIALEPMTHDEHGDGWLATRVEGPAVCMEFGQTMLIAAMRCYVASHLGDEVQVPEELK